MTEASDSAPVHVESSQNKTIKPDILEWIQAKRRMLNGFDTDATYDPEIIAATQRICQAFTERGKALLMRGCPHIAIGDFSDALMLHPPQSGKLTWETEANSCRYAAIGQMNEFFAEARQSDTAFSRQNYHLPIGYLIAADNGTLLYAFPLTQEGHTDAMAHAQRISTDADLRHEFDEAYLTDSDEFDVDIFKHEKGTLTHLSQHKYVPEYDE